MYFRDINHVIRFVSQLNFEWYYVIAIQVMSSYAYTQTADYKEKW